MEMDTTEKKQGYFLKDHRGKDFKELIIKILRHGCLKQKYIDILTSEESLKEYAKAFTSDHIDQENNYQVAEQRGDVTVNKIIIVYMYNKFPQLNCAKGVQIVARLRINFGSRNFLAELARGLGMWPFILATNDLRQRKMKDLLEDVFEAFFGMTELIIDNYMYKTKKVIGVGYSIVYKILSSILDKTDISLRYEDLYDAKTRLKELFDIHEQNLGPLVYYDEKKNDIHYSTIYRVEGGKPYQKPDGSLNKNRITGGNPIKIGSGYAALKADAQQNAAANALDTLKKQGWEKPPPEIFNCFNNDGNTEKIFLDIDSVKKNWGTDMNVLQPTGKKTRYQNKYLSTPVTMYARNRVEDGVKICLEMGGNPNIPDSDGMFTADLLFIGSVDENLVEGILRLLADKEKLKMHRQIFNMYYTQYVGKYFIEMADKIDLVDE